MLNVDSSKNLPLLSNKYISAIKAQTARAEEVLEKKAEKLLLQLQKQEKRLKKKLIVKDSVAAVEIFGNIANRYNDLEQKKIIKKELLSSFVPRVDTLVNTLAFLQQNPYLLGHIKNGKEKLIDATEHLNVIKEQLSKAENIRQFIRERRQYLKDQLTKFGLSNQLRKLNKKAYYYSQLIKDYKELLNKPHKIEKQTLGLLNRIPAFRKFIEKNSFLTSLFGNSSYDIHAVSMVGLQTRSSVQQRITSSFTEANQNPAQFVSQQLQTASSRLSALQNRISFVDLSGSPEEMPDFKPNTQKTKPLLKRIELGANVQFGKTNRLLPSSGDFAFSLGYKINDNGVIGIGSSYKLGIGFFERIQFTHQGFGLRSYIDWKIKSGFFFSGGYERNYLPQLNNINLAVQPQVWQESGLIGVSKRYSVGKKKKMNLQLLFDFLSYRNIPRSQPVIFRTGWIF